MLRETTLASTPIVEVTTLVGRPVVSLIGEMDAASAGMVPEAFERLDGCGRECGDLGGSRS